MNEEGIKGVLGLEKIKTRHWGIISCSAKSGDGLQEGIDWVVNDVAARVVNDVAARIFMLELKSFYFLFFLKMQ